MGACSVSYDEIRFDVRHADVTDVYVYCRLTGDCPQMLEGWHFKSFSAGLTTAHIHGKLFSDDEHNPISWACGAPRN
jgi:hypothetical protein